MDFDIINLSNLSDLTSRPDVPDFQGSLPSKCLQSDLGCFATHKETHYMKHPSVVTARLYGALGRIETQSYPTYAYLPDHTHQETIKEINSLWDYSSS